MIKSYLKEMWGCTKAFGALYFILNFLFTKDPMAHLFFIYCLLCPLAIIATRKPEEKKL